jgi:oligopeptidase B
VHVRGGGELGPAWHEAGRKLLKLNSAHDLLGVAARMVDSGVGSSRSLCLSGTSAGGLAVCKAALLRPSLFRAVLLHVAFLDPVAAMLDAKHALTKGEYEEWGDPADPTAWRNLLEISPYHDQQFLNPTPEPLPAFMVTCAEDDPRVPPWHSAKIVAQLRARERRRVEALGAKGIRVAPRVAAVLHVAGHGHFTLGEAELRRNSKCYAFLLHTVAPESGQT